MAFNWKILELKEIKDELVKIISSDEKLNKILVDQEGVLAAYTLNDEEYEKFAKIGFASTCFSEKEVSEFVRSALLSNIDAFAKWLKEDRLALKLDVKFHMIVGKRTDRGMEVEPHNVRITIRKDLADSTEYGFFVSGVIPY